MTKYVGVQTGNWSTAATWNQIANTESIHASTSITVTSGGVYSATFTAPNTTNAVTGVLVYCSAVGTAGTIVFTLQENSISTAATTSLTITDLQTSGWFFVKLPTPYVYTATTAGYYRWKINTSGASGTTSLAANSGGTNFAFGSTDDRTAVPTTGDDVYIAGNNLAAVVVTVDDTSRLVGSGAATGAPLARTTTAAIYLANGGALGWSTTADATLEVKGQILSAVNGEIQMGTVATPIPAAYTARLITNQNGADVKYDLQVESAGKWKMQGASRTFWKTKFVSGTGTAASPLVTFDAVDWNVGDEITITGQGSYNEYEKRFIITKNSSTSYVLSSTSGGAENALVNAHDSDDRIILLTRNVIITSKVTTEAWCFTNKAATAGYVDCDWMRVEYVGGTAAARRGFQVTTNGAAQIGSVDYSVVYLPDLYAISWTTTSTASTHTGIVVYGQSGASNVSAIILSGAKNITLVNCYAIANYAAGFNLATVGNIVLTNCEAWNNNQGAVSSGGGINFSNAFSVTLNEFVCQSTRGRALYANGCSDIVFNDAMIGNYGSNTIDVYVVSDTFNKILFSSTTIGSATSVSNYLNLIPGSEIVFDRYNATDNRHLWYTPYGVNYATGASLPDTTTVYTSHLSVRLSPEDSATGCFWEFQILARPGYYVSAQGLAQKNAAFGTDDLIVDLYLPDSTAPDATVTMPDNTSVNVFNIGAVYSGSIPRLATVRITAKSVAASAYAYVGRLFNGTNSITSIDTWYNGKPAQIMYPELGDPDAVWAVATSGLTTTGTTGKKLVDGLTTAKFLGLK